MKKHFRFTLIFCIAALALFATYSIASERGVTQAEKERRCAASHGTTGTALPALIQEAIKVFPRDRYALRPDQVVYITNFNGFVDCMGIQSEATRNFLFRQELMVFHNDFPIYFNANDEAVDAFRLDGRQSYLKYIFAGFLGNGWMHATGEPNDYPAYSLELLLLQGYKKRLPKNDLMDDHFDEVRDLMEKSRMSDGTPLSTSRTALDR